MIPQELALSFESDGGLTAEAPGRGYGWQLVFNCPGRNCFLQRSRFEPYHSQKALTARHVTQSKEPSTISLISATSSVGVAHRRLFVVRCAGLYKPDDASSEGLRNRSALHASALFCDGRILRAVAAC